MRARERALAHAQLRRLLEEAANAADGDALFLLGTLFAEGSALVPRDLEQARQCFELAGEQGNHDALCSLGALYFNGVGVPRNQEVRARACACVRVRACGRSSPGGRWPQMAFRIYDEAARMGSSQAWANMARSVARGARAGQRS